MKTILHCDLNNFYASVEMILHPEHQGVPLAVCGDPEKRHGIILAKNQLAKNCGVKTAETIWEAKQKCPDLHLLPPTYSEYVKYSNLVFEIYQRFTDRVESFGLDECWLDVTGSENLFGSGKEIADKIRETVKKETGLTISVGVSFSKVFSKLGSDMKKPDATTVISLENYKKTAWTLPVNDLLMIGKQTAKKLNLMGIYTIGDLAKADLRTLQKHFGIVADRMIESANGKDDSEVKKYFEKQAPKSVGHGTTTAVDITTYEDAKVVIYALSELVSTRLRRYKLAANSVSIQLKSANFESISRQMPLPYSTANASDIAEASLTLLKANHFFPNPLRLITVTAMKLIPETEIQMTLFDEEREREERLEKTVDKIRQKYGFNSVKRGVLLDNKIISGNLHEDDDFKPFKK